MISSGIVSMYCRSRNTPVGVATVGRITPQSVLKRPVAEMIEKSGTRITDSGIISVATIRISTADRPRNWYFDSAKAAIELVTSVMIVATTVTKTEFCA